MPGQTEPVAQVHQDLGVEGQIRIELHRKIRPFADEGGKRGREDNLRAGLGPADLDAAQDGDAEIRLLFALDPETGSVDIVNDTHRLCARRAPRPLLSVATIDDAEPLAKFEKSHRSERQAGTLLREAMGKQMVGEFARQHGFRRASRPVFRIAEKDEKAVPALNRVPAGEHLAIDIRDRCCGLHHR